MTGDLRERLADRTLELVDVPSESRHEAAILDHLTRAIVQRNFAFDPALR